MDINIDTIIGLKNRIKSPDGDHNSKENSEASFEYDNEPRTRV